MHMGDYLPVCLCAMCVQCLWGLGEGVRPPGTGLSHHAYRYWKLSPGPLEEKAAPSLAIMRIRDTSLEVWKMPSIVFLSSCV